MTTNVPAQYIERLEAGNFKNEIHDTVCVVFLLVQLRTYLPLSFFEGGVYTNIHIYIYS